MTRAVVDYDRGEVGWRTPDKQAPASRDERAKALANAPAILTYDFQVPHDGWYELIVEGGSHKKYATTLIDGQRLFSGKQTDDDLISTKPRRYKRASVFLNAGEHTLTLKQLHYPQTQPRAWSLRAVDGQPAHCLRAQVVGHDILRRGEPLVLDITGGTRVPSHYDLVVRKQQTPGADWKKVAEVRFDAGDVQTQRVPVLVDEEGVFDLRVRYDGKLLRPGDLLVRELVVVDTQAKPTVNLNPAKTLLYDIDCVEQTNQGSPMAKGNGFWQANGPTRVSATSAGTYRETADNMADAPLMYAHGGKSLAGFSYAIDVDQTQVPYLLEVDYPDDDRRTANIIVMENLKDQPGQHGYSQAHLGSGYETGGGYPLSGKMQTHRVIFWPTVNAVRVGVISMHEGMRAAAARIRVYRLDGGLPVGPARPHDGRLYASYFEEPGRWKVHMRSAQTLYEASLPQEYLGIERWCQMARYTGMNGLWPTEVIYQQATYRSQLLDGWSYYSHDVVRLVALLAEKYDLRYVPEVHLSRPQHWYYQHTIKGLIETPGTLTVNRFGKTGTYANTLAPYFNPLHPDVQQLYLDVVGELVDKVSDTESFAGFASRLMTWSGASWNTLVSLNWGYDDWTIAQFKEDSGLVLPEGTGDADGPERFSKRFDFLTGPARSTWERWRMDRMLAFYRRLRDRIRQDNPQAVLYLRGLGLNDADPSFRPLSNDPAGIAREMGIDVEQLADEPGIAPVPTGAYGRAKTYGPLADQKQADQMLDPEYLALGMGQHRAFSFGNTYFEVHKRIPINHLGLPGLKPGGYCGAADAAGRHALERLAIVLADQDSTTMCDGGLGYTFGQAQYLSDWVGAFAALPPVPFEPIDQARDPVAVWQHRAQDSFYFYAVNRESYPTTLKLSLTDVTSVTELAASQAMALNDGVLLITLKPFELRSFKAGAPARISQVQTQVPDERINLVRSRLAFAQQVWELIGDGPRHDDVTDEQRTAFRDHLDQAWQAFANGHYWRARVALSMSPMLAVFKQLDRTPPGQLATQMPGMLQAERTSQYEPNAAPMLDAQAIQQLTENNGSANAVQVLPASQFNPALPGQILWASKGKLRLTLSIPVPGRYRLSLGHLAKQPGAATVSMNGQLLPDLMVTEQAQQCESTVWPTLVLPAGDAVIELQSGQAFGLYGLILDPIYRTLPGEQWATLGPFKAPWSNRFQPDAAARIKEGMNRVDPPMKGIDGSAAYPGANGKTLTWQRVTQRQGPHAETGVNFLHRAGVSDRHLCYAVTWIDSPTSRDAELWIGTDWWANVYLNGEKIQSERDPKQVAGDGAQFNGWKPQRAIIHLRPGRNELLIKNHGGSAASWFTARITDPGDLNISVEPLN